MSFVGAKGITEFRRRVLGAAVAILLVSARSLVAQSVSGVVLLPDSVSPAAGVIVVATDDRGTTAGRALTGDRGQFTLRVPAPGQYSIALLRIGFRPTQLPPLQIGATAGPLVRFVLANQPVVLSSVNVRDRETCRVSADTGMMVARVWEEARKAMLTTQLVSEGAPLVADWIEYDRGMDSSAHVVRQQRVRASQNPTTHAFKSRPAAELDSTGYVVSDTTGTTYYAPDADVLLSDPFAAGALLPSRGAAAVGGNAEPDRRRVSARARAPRQERDRRHAVARSHDAPSFDRSSFAIRICRNTLRRRIRAAASSFSG